ncbi:MAG: DUF4474 domain-containing protein [Clostridia bacterium]|nr:DUF4474 domain-containing protein [Clostridia bacterium]
MKAKKISLIIMSCIILVSSVLVSATSATKTGDVNGNDDVNSSDALLVLQHCTGLVTLNESWQVAADVNNDGKITASDALSILQIATGVNENIITTNDQTIPTITYPTPSSTTTNKPMTTWVTTTTQANISSISATTSDNNAFSYKYIAKDKCFIINDEAYKKYGKNELYDEIAISANFGYDTINIYFPYKDKNWMIQFWKGKYGMVLKGAEIGVYNRSISEDASNMLYCSVSESEMLPVGLELYENNTLLFARPQRNTRLQTGFIPGDSSNSGNSAYTSKLKVISSITFNDEEMTVAFVGGLQAVSKIYNNVDAINANDTNAGYRSFTFTEGDGSTPGTYSVNGNTVTLSWS